MTRLRAAIVLSGVGHVLHNLEEFGFTPAAITMTVLPVAVTVLLWVAARRPTRRFHAIAWTWAMIVVLSSVTVLPLPFLPFEPAQTVSHYATHIVYALLQVPLLIVAWRGWHPLSQHASEPAS